MEITQRFGDKTVLEDISLTLKKGEIFGLLGPVRSRENNTDQDTYGTACTDRRKGGSIGNGYQKTYQQYLHKDGHGAG